ncbi:Uncaracterized surface protein containing fasciclin (FAS1) repeats [Mesonia phycicola]|uniref:Uncaracterized surface protein containing fasciclin (FAS1) repeats n=1 Tax=Mesonia phycicola TaxID=579105 RepID=A0A1M6A725_9FLAO|nr:fasciclin domain-containing protein [Mesonia phycicola]SHI32246.1 Uncaracterized surface protein containing fasciclin (FAS1) repeats [Mesonia phycicola]
MKISKSIKSSFAILALVISATGYSQKTKMVGGAEMYPTKNIIENAVNSKDHTTLVVAVKAADLVETLQGDGPFTVFAPTNTAFSHLPEGTVENLMKAENKPVLQSILTYHVVAGNWSAKDIAKMIKKNGGKVNVETVNGSSITMMMDGKKLKIKDASGNIATVTIADVNQSNGVIHVIDTVLLPKM